MKTYDELWNLVRALPENKQAGLLQMLFGWMESARNPEFQKAIGVLLENHFEKMQNDTYKN